MATSFFNGVSSLRHVPFANFNSSRTELHVLFTTAPTSLSNKVEKIGREGHKFKYFLAKLKTFFDYIYTFLWFWHWNVLALPFWLRKFDGSSKFAFLNCSSNLLHDMHIPIPQFRFSRHPIYLYLAKSPSITQYLSSRRTYFSLPSYGKMLKQGFLIALEIVTNFRAAAAEQDITCAAENEGRSIREWQ